MATATSRRPKTVNDLEDPATGHEKKAIAVPQVTNNKYGIFKNTMGSWYLNLPRKRKATLLKHDIVKKAKEEADKLSINYRTLNPNWLKELNEEHGVDFYEPSPEEMIRRKEFHELRKKLLNPSILEEQMKIEEVEQLLKLTVGSISNKMITEVMKKVQTTAEVESGEKLELVKPSLYCPSKYKMLPVLKQKISKKTKTATSTKIIPRRVKCADLSNEPPPKEWIDSYKKGKLLPRTMKCQYLSDKKTVVAYYDYDVSRTEHSSGYEPKIHESNHVLGIEEDKNVSS